MPETRPDASGHDESTERWLLVERIIATRHFSRAPQLREFLLFVSRRVLFDGRAEASESEIARKVLGRADDFDPREDNIVRVQARQLRARLADYFKNEGRDEPVVLTIPKRSYLPQFEERAREAAESESGLPSPPRSRRLWAVVTVCCVLLAALFSIRSFRTGVQTVQTSSSPAANPLLRRVFHPGQATSIIVADNGLTLVQDILGANVSLDDYLQRDFDEKIPAVASTPEMRSMLKAVLLSQVTSLADAVVAARFGQQSVLYGGRVVVRSAKQINARDLRAGDFIMVGGPRAVPWIALFQDRLNFRMEGNPKMIDFWFVNRLPAPGEQKRYASHIEPTLRETYAVLSLLPGPGEKGDVLLLSGLTMDATEAAAEFAARGAFPRDVADWLRADGHYGEFLLRSRGVSGETWNAELIAYRKIDLSERPALRLPKQ